MTDTTRTVREIAGTLRHFARYVDDNEAYTEYIELVTALEAITSMDPWHTRPEMGWTDATLPEDAAMVNFIFSGCVQIGNYDARVQKFIGDKYAFPAIAVEAYMVIPEYVDPPAPATTAAGEAKG